MSELTPEFVRAAVGGAYRARGEAVGLAGGVSIDTRTIKPGQIFAAFRGERADGHAFLHQARKAGCALAIVERGGAMPERLPEGMTLIEVESTRAALGQLARAYRRTLSSTRVIAVTGSNGKTTTVRLIDRVLGSRLRGSASVKSFNNDIGLPLTILGAKPTDQYVVCEAGMSSPGEIGYLARIASPDVAVITSVGRAHLEKMGSVREIAREKASLLSGLSPGGLGVVPAEALELEEFLQPGSPIVRFGVGESADLRVLEVEAHAGGVRFATNGGQRYEVGLLGAHNAHNAAAAIAVARRLGLGEGEIAEALAGARGAEMRLDRRVIAGIEVINDAYNANPDSVLAAVRAFGGLTRGAGRRVLVLGEMLELGEAGPGLHEEVGRAVAGAIRRGEGPDFVVLVGDLARHAQGAIAAELGPVGVVLEPKTGDGRSIAGRLLPGDAVLIKGSRSVGLERVVEAMESPAAS